MIHFNTSTGRWEEEELEIKPVSSLVSVRDLMKKVDGELVAVKKDGNWISPAKVKAWSNRMREEEGLSSLPVKTIKKVKDKDGVWWYMYVDMKETSHTWIEVIEAERSLKPIVEVVDLRLTDPNAPASNHLSKHTKGRRRRR